MMPGLCLYTV